MHKAVLFLIAIVFLSLASPQAGRASGCTDCSQNPIPELEGQWQGHVVTADVAGGSGVATLSLTLDDHGALVSGSLVDLSGTTVHLTTGCLIIDSTGQLGGSFIDESGVQWCLPNGRMSLDKDLISFVYQTWNDLLGHAVLIRQGGSFSQSDLDGAYKGQTFRTGASPIGPGDVNLRISNGMLGQSDYNWLPGATASYLSGTLVLNGSGSLTGTLTTADGMVQTIADGLMSGNKSLLSAALKHSDGRNSALFLVRGDGATSIADLGGTWLLLATETGSAGKVSVLNGGLNMDTLGRVAYGSYSYLLGGDGSILGGNLGVFSDGTLYGQYLRDDLSWCIVVDGIMDKSKDVISLTYSDANGRLGKAVLVRKNYAEAPSDEGSLLPVSSSGSSSGGGGGGCIYDPGRSLSVELLAILGACAAVLTVRRMKG